MLKAFRVVLLLPHHLLLTACNPQECRVLLKRAFPGGNREHARGHRTGCASHSPLPSGSVGLRVVWTQVPWRARLLGYRCIQAPTRSHCCE